MEALHNLARQHEQNRIDQPYPKTERNYDKGKGEKYKKRFEEEIQNAENDDDRNQSTPAFIFNPR